jgi:hypothetical protein
MVSDDASREVVKIGAKVTVHARHRVFQMAEVALLDLLIVFHRTFSPTEAAKR